MDRPPPTLETLAPHLAAHRPRRVPGARLWRQAAVAAVLHGHREPELLLIERARRPGDPWAGDMAFPGGRLQPGDADTRTAAVRETREEIGLDLDRVGRPLGALSTLVARSHRGPLPMMVTPYVFALEARPTGLVLGAEVAGSVSVPLAFLMGSGRREWYVKRVLGLPIPFPCYRYRGHLIWGLTLRMIDELRSLVRAAQRDTTAAGG